MSSKSTDTNPARWMLGGEPPEPQDVPTEVKAVDVDDLRNGDTHTGTDPLGRAIGPREDHLKVKRVRDGEGKIVTPKPGKGQTIAKAESRAARIAEATDTTAEAVDEPKPYTPAEVAKAHADGDVLDAPAED